MKPRSIAAGAFPTSISYRITGQDTPLGGRRLILEIELAAISACQFGLRTRDTGTINREHLAARTPAAPGSTPHDRMFPAQSAMCVQAPASAD